MSSKSYSSLAAMHYVMRSDLLGINKNLAFLPEKNVDVEIDKL